MLAVDGGEQLTDTLLSDPDPGRAVMMHVPSWGLLGAPASAEVRDVEATPYIVGSVEPRLARVLTEAWPHDYVLAALP